MAQGPLKSAKLRVETTRMCLRSHRRQCRSGVIDLRMSNDTTYEQIRAAIASGELRPHTRLVEADLGERFGASRPSTIRQSKELLEKALV